MANSPFELVYANNKYRDLEEYVSPDYSSRFGMTRDDGRVILVSITETIEKICKDNRLCGGTQKDSLLFARGCENVQPYGKIALEHLFYLYRMMRSVADLSRLKAMMDEALLKKINEDVVKICVGFQILFTYDRFIRTSDAVIRFYRLVEDYRGSYNPPVPALNRDLGKRLVSIMDSLGLKTALRGSILILYRGSLPTRDECQAHLATLEEPWSEFCELSKQAGKYDAKLYGAFEDYVRRMMQF